MKIRVLRNQQLESEHDVDLLIMRSNGEVLYQSSESARLRKIFPRSAIKMLQALPLAETGAIREFQLSEAEVALACASHAGEELHTNAVSAWLNRLGYKISDLHCGAHWPYDFDTKLHLACIKEKPTALHNNCSGKHAGFLTLAKKLNVDASTYERWESPIQTRIRQSLTQICDFAFDAADWAVDGCGIPTYYAPIEKWALGLARFAEQALDKSSPAGSIYSAFRSKPVFTSGHHETTFKFLQMYPDAIFKSGAEGVFAGILPKQKAAVMIKVHDGHERASRPAMVWALNYLGVQPNGEPLDFQIRNWSEMVVGKLELIQN